MSLEDTKDMSVRSLPSELKTQISTYLGSPRSAEAVLRTSPEYLIEEIRLYQPSFSLEGLLDYLIGREQLKKRNSLTPGGRLYPLTLLYFLNSFLIEKAATYNFFIISRERLRIPQFFAVIEPENLSYVSLYDPDEQVYEYQGHFSHNDPNIVQQLNYQAQLSRPPLAPLLSLNNFYEVDKSRVGLPVQTESI